MNKKSITFLSLAASVGLAVSLVVANNYATHSIALGENTSYSLTFTASDVDPDFIDANYGEAYLYKTVNTSDDDFEVDITIYGEDSYTYLTNGYIFELESPSYGEYASGSMSFNFSMCSMVNSVDSFVLNGSFKFANKGYTQDKLTYSPADMTIGEDIYDATYTSYTLFVNYLEVARVSSFTINYSC